MTQDATALADAIEHIEGCMAGVEENQGVTIYSDLTESKLIVAHLRAASQTPDAVRVEKVERHPGPFTGPDAELARACAMITIPDYGNDDPDTHQRIMRDGIWNDHIAVQTALTAIHSIRKASLHPQPQQADPTPTKEDFAKWSRVWHDTCETMMTVLGLSGNGSPQEMLVAVQAHVSAQPQQADVRGAVIDPVRDAFRNADAQDWRYIAEQIIGFGGHDKFWRAVFKDVRTALSTSTDADAPVQGDGVREALEKIAAIAPETDLNRGCQCTVCEMRRIAETALQHQGDSRQVEEKLSPTLGSSIDLLIGLAFQRVETLDPEAKHRHYRECGCCGGTDENREYAKSEIGKIAHAEDCPLVRDMPILRSIGLASDEACSFVKGERCGFCDGPLPCLTHRQGMSVASAKSEAP